MRSSRQHAKSVKQYELYCKQNSPLYYSDLINRKVYMFNSNYKNKCYVRFLNKYEFENLTEHEKKNLLRELTKTEIKEILDVYKKQKENFTKRLNTYLKKYGLSKLHTWTYLVD